jgi:putative transport protein
MMIAVRHGVNCRLPGGALEETTMIKLLLDNLLLLLFLVSAIGYLIGQISFGGVKLGVAAVLFVGLAAGALHPDMKLPEFVYLFGLVVFVYAIGLSSGAAFFASFRDKGLRDNLFILAMLVVGAALTGVAWWAGGLRPAVAAGMFAGSFTNTPALAAVLDYIKTHAPTALRDQMLAEPVVGYSITYPMGVVGVMIAITVMQKIWKIDYAKEGRGMRGAGGGKQVYQNRTIRVLHDQATREPLQNIIARFGWDVVFGRLRHTGQLALVDGQTLLHPGDLVSVTGASKTLDSVTAYLGEPSDEHLEYDRGTIDMRRMFVSNPKLFGRRLRDLNLPGEYGALVTRLRRGDTDLLAHGDTMLEPGDRVRVIAHRDKMEAVSAFFGDSYRALSEIDILTFNLGMALGVLLGMIPIPLPGGVVFKLGFAGGPLLVGLILGALERTGPIVWSLPYSAGLLLRQLGLILFLAGVGTRSGYAFVTTLTQGNGALIFVAGALITCGTALITLWVGYRLLKVPLGVLIGMLAALQTQPALLSFAQEQAGNELPNIGYATVYPIAIIGKILLAQLLLILLMR